jgi:hypothetical protein
MKAPRMAAAAMFVTEGCGTGFGPFAENGSWSDAVLYNSCSLPDCTHGLVPAQGPLVSDAGWTLVWCNRLRGTCRNCNGAGCGVA